MKEVHRIYFGKMEVQYICKNNVIVWPVGLNNYVFVGTPSMLIASAILFSLSEAAKSEVNAKLGVYNPVLANIEGASDTFTDALLKPYSTVKIDSSINESSDFETYLNVLKAILMSADGYSSTEHDTDLLVAMADLLNAHIDETTEIENHLSVLQSVLFHEIIKSQTINHTLLMPLMAIVFDQLFKSRTYDNTVLMPLLAIIMNELFSSKVHENMQVLISEAILLIMSLASNTRAEPNLLPAETKKLNGDLNSRTKNDAALSPSDSIQIGQFSESRTEVEGKLFVAESTKFDDSIQEKSNFVGHIVPVNTDEIADDIHSSTDMNAIISEIMPVILRAFLTETSEASPHLLPAQTDIIRGDMRSKSTLTAIVSDALDDEANMLNLEANSRSDSDSNLSVIEIVSHFLVHQYRTALTGEVNPCDTVGVSQNLQECSEFESGFKLFGIINQMIAEKVISIPSAIMSVIAALFMNVAEQNSVFETLSAVINESAAMNHIEAFISDFVAAMGGSAPSIYMDHSDNFDITDELSAIVPGAAYGTHEENWGTGTEVSAAAKQAVYGSHQEDWGTTDEFSSYSGSAEYVAHSDDFSTPYDMAAGVYHAKYGSHMQDQLLREAVSSEIYETEYVSEKENIHVDGAAGVEYATPLPVVVVAGAKSDIEGDVDVIRADQMVDISSEALSETEEDISAEEAAPEKIDTDRIIRLRIVGEISISAAATVSGGSNTNSDTYVEITLGYDGEDEDTVWFDPVHTGTNLYIRSVYDSAQEGTNVTIR